MAFVLSPLAWIGSSILNVLGFTKAGVAAKSLAASVQTATTVAGSNFALLQSAGATGAGVSAAVGAGAIGTCAGASVAIGVVASPPHGSRPPHGKAIPPAEEGENQPFQSEEGYPTCVQTIESARAANAATVIPHALL